MLLKWSRYCSKHNVFISLHSLQFFQWLVLLQCSGQNYCSSGSQTNISEAVKALYTILLGVNWIHIKNVCVAMVAITREASDIATCFSWHFIASIQGLPTSSFWLLTECKMEGEGLVPLSASDINVYLGRQRVGGLEWNSMFHTCILHPAKWATTFLLHKCLELEHISR